MKALNKVITEYPQYKQIATHIHRKIGIDGIHDVTNHGADAGYNGFTYYTETCGFYSKFRKLINNMILEMATDLGENPTEMLGGFNCLKLYDHKANKWDDPKEMLFISKCLFGERLDKETETIENALAWFALEEICRLFDE